VKNRTAATASFQERDAAMTATRSAVYSYDELLRSWQHNDFEEAPKIFSITTTGSSAPIMVHVTSVGEAWINGSQISREGVSRPGLIISRDEFMSAQTVDAAMLRPNLRGSFKGDREEKTNPIPRIRRIRNDNNWTTPLWKRTKGPGGIDLNTADGMQWNISKDGRGVEINIDPALIERVRRQGIDSLSPFILKMTPVSISSFY